jgi:hypothetical protein
MQASQGRENNRSIDWGKIPPSRWANVIENDDSEEEWGRFLDVKDVQFCFGITTTEKKRAIGNICRLKR